MNKCEIIERLKNIAEHAVHTVGEKPFVMSIDDGIAVYEAVELLKNPETNCSEIPNNSDTISRQAAIDKITKRLYETAFNNIGIKQDIDETLVDVAENRLENWFNELPPIQPVQRWIPCSERLPEVGKGVLLTTTFPTVIIGWLKSDGKWMIYENDGNSFQDYIIAWMPLPEPWKGEEDETD